MIDMNGGYGHVNFSAKANQENSKEELFFAQL
jgi:surface antigen